jgi:hypothetical protein
VGRLESVSNANYPVRRNANDPGGWMPAVGIPNRGRTAIGHRERDLT